MTRLIPWPRGLSPSARQPLTGPRSVRAGGSESLSGFAQSVASPFGLWRWSFAFPALSGPAARRFRGFVTALHGGANIVAVPFCDPDGLTWPELGVTTTPAEIRRGLPWTASGQPAPWSGGELWSPGRPVAAVLAAAARGDDVVTVSAAGFGLRLDIGDQVGFGPGYLGLHVVTERIDDGVLRIWPPLRRALTTASHLTLEPVMAMRMESESGASVARGIASIESPQITLLEVEDADVRLLLAG